MINKFLKKYFPAREVTVYKDTVLGLIRYLGAPKEVENEFHKMAESEKLYDAIVGSLKKNKNIGDLALSSVATLTRKALFAEYIIRPGQALPKGTEINYRTVREVITKCGYGHGEVLDFYKKVLDEMVNKKVITQIYADEMLKDILDQLAHYY